MPLSRKEKTGLALALGAIVLFSMLVGRLVISGDEPRYILYATSIWQDHQFVMPAAEWAQKSDSLLHYHMAELPTMAGGVILGHPIYISFLLSPLAAFGSGGLRLAGLLAGIGGLAFLYAIIRRVTTHPIAIASILTAGLTFPLMSYIHTFWSEVFIFAAISAGIYCLRSGSNLYLRAAAILFIPFVHLRASVVGAALFLELMFNVRESKRALTWLVAMAAFFMIALIALNFLVYGSITGSVNSARPPLPWAMFDVAATNLVSVKGLLPYAPIWLLGYVGLISASIKRERLAIDCLILAVVALMTSIGPNPGEGWPGRFMVTSIPMLAVGFAYWLLYARSISAKVVTLTFAIPTVVNTVLFAFRSSIHIESRQSDRVYSFLFDKFRHLNPGLFLPVEYINVQSGRILLTVAIVFCALLVIGTVLPKRWPYYVVLIAALSLVDLTRVHEIPVVQKPIDGGVSVAIPATQRVKLQFARTYYRWSSPPEWPLITVTDDCATKTRQANPVISLNCKNGVGLVKITSPNGFDVTGEAHRGLRAFSSSSLLLRTYDHLF